MFNLIDKYGRTLGTVHATGPSVKTVPVRTRFLLETYTNKFPQIVNDASDFWQARLDRETA